MIEGIALHFSVMPLHYLSVALILSTVPKEPFPAKPAIDRVRPTPDGRGGRPISVDQAHASLIERPVFGGQVEMLLASIRP